MALKQVPYGFPAGTLLLSIVNPRAFESESNVSPKGFTWFSNTNWMFFRGDYHVFRIVVLRLSRSNRMIFKEAAIDFQVGIILLSIMNQMALSQETHRLHVRVPWLSARNPMAVQRES